MSESIQKHEEQTATPAMEVRPTADIYEGEHDFQIVLDVPGVTKENVNVAVEQDTLTVTAERYLGQLEATRFKRVFSLPKSIELEKVSASLRNGVLSLTLPKLEAVKPRQIKVRAA